MSSKSSSPPESGEMPTPRGPRPPPNKPPPRASRRPSRSPSTSKSPSKSAKSSKSPSPSRSPSSSGSGSRSRSGGRGRRGRSRSARKSRSRGRSRSVSVPAHHYYRGRSVSLGRYEELAHSTSTVYVAGLAADTDERRLREFFRQYGAVAETKVVLDPETQASRRFGFVKFESTGDADLAVSQAHGKTLDGKTIRCNLARYPPPSKRQRSEREKWRERPRDRRGMRVRGRGEYKYHRSVSRSPGRWGDGSPSHARSMSRSVSRSITPRRKRARHTRSRSYSRSRSRGWSPRYGRDRRRYSRGYKARSRSRSDPRRSRAGKRSRGAASPRSSSSLGNSFTSGASNDSRKMAKAVVTNTRKDLLEAKKREQQLISRVAALEADVKKGQGAKEAAMARVEAMSSQVKAVGERSKNRGAMLAKLVEALKSVEDLRGRVKDAECFLEDLTQSAIDMMQEEEREFEREEQVRREAERLAAAQRSLVEQNPAPEEPSGKPTENGVEKLDPPDSPDANDDARQTREGDKSAEGGQGWRRPLTFKFNL